MKVLLLSLSCFFISYSNSIKPEFCGCIGGLKSILKEVNSSDVIINGNLLTREVIDYRDTASVFMDGDSARYMILKFSRQKFTFKIKVVYKGRINDDTLSVMSGVSNGDCGIDLKPGHNYLVYTNYQKDIRYDSIFRGPYLYTDMCYRTRLYDKKEEDSIKLVLRK